MNILKLISLIVSLCVLSTVNAQGDQEFTLEDIEQSENFSLEEFQSINELQEKITENNKTKIPLTFKKEKKDKYVPPVFRALLKRGSKLISMQSGKSFRVAREVFVKAQQKIFGEYYTYILNSSGEWVYKTKTLNLISIEEDMSFGYSTIDPKETYKKSYRYNMENKNILIDHRLIVALESMEANLYADLFNLNDQRSASATRIDWRAFYKWQLPIEFGLSLAYQDGNYSNKTLTWKAINFGPLIRYDIGKLKENIFLKISSGVQKSAFYEAIIGGQNFQLTALTWHLDLETEIKTRWGNWIFGIEYREQNSGIEADPYGIIQDDSTKDNIKSIGFVFGREFNLIL